MKFTWFNLMPWPYLPDDFREKNRSVWVDIDQKLFDPGEEPRGLQHLSWTCSNTPARVGFDGIGVQRASPERLRHHAQSPNIIAAALARRTKDAALVVLGNSIALYNPPVRVAEEFAMLDCISGGRLVAGFPVGTSMDTNFCYGQIPALTREKYQEAHDLIIKAWTERKPFAFNGRYNKLRHVNIWPRPIQQPHPPIHIPGGGSVETYDFCIDNTYSYSYLSFSGYIRAKALMDGYWKRVAERNAPDTSPYRAGFAQTICVADTDEEAERLYSRARQLFLQSLPARLSGLRRRAGLPHHQDHPDRRAVAIRAAARRLRQADLEGPDRGRPRHRRLAGDRAPAHGGADQGAARRQHLLPDACRQHAEGEVHVFDQAVRREGDAEAAQHVPGVRRRRPLLVQADRKAGAAPAGCRRDRDAARQPCPACWRKEDVIVELKTVKTQHTSRSAISKAAAARRWSSCTAPAASRRTIRSSTRWPRSITSTRRCSPATATARSAGEIRDMLDFTLHTWDVVEALGLKDPILVGHSMGGMIAAEMAAIAPNDVSRLALIARPACGSTIIRSPTCSRRCRSRCRRCSSTMSRPARR